LIRDHPEAHLLVREEAESREVLEEEEEGEGGKRRENLKLMTIWIKSWRRS